MMASATIEMYNPDYVSATLQLSGPRTYVVDAQGRVMADKKNMLELMSLGFWPVAHDGSNDSGGLDNSDDYDPGDLTIAFQNNLI